MWSWLSDSRGKVSLVLLAVWLAALFHSFNWLKVIYPLLSIFMVLVVDAAVTRLRSGQSYFSLSGVVTGLLIGLIFDPRGSIWLFLVASLVAVVDKQFLRINIHHHLFNPAALGIVVAAQVMQGNVGWWAAWGILPVVILGLGMTWVLWRLHRLFLPLTFLVVYFLINYLRVGALESARFVFDGTVFLFAFIMLPEPMTSLARGQWQYLWGTLVGVTLFILIHLPVPLVDPLLTALLLTNLVGFFWVNWLEPRFLSGNA